jgi:membrane protease YdiL (CAAX protease family)
MAKSSASNAKVKKANVQKAGAQKAKTSPISTAKTTPSKKQAVQKMRRGFAPRISQTFRSSWNGIAPLRKNAGLFFGIAGAVALSQLALWWKPLAGVYANAGLFALLLGLALWKESFRKLAISVAILPIAIMIDLCLPQGNAFGQAAVFYDAILLLTLVYRFMFALDEPIKSTALKLRGYAFALPLMAVLGQLLGVLGYGMLRHQYAFKNISLPLVAVTACVFALTEEMFFRGLIQQRAAKVMHPAIAAALSTILFALANIGYGTILAPLYALIAGAVLSVTYYKKQNLLLTFTINAMSKLAYVGLLATFVLR